MECRVPGAGCRVLGVGCWVLGAGCLMLCPCTLHAALILGPTATRNGCTHHGYDLALLPSGPDAVRRPEIAQVPGRGAARHR